MAENGGEERHSFEELFAECKRLREESSRLMEKAKALAVKVDALQRQTKTPAKKQAKPN